MIESGITSLEEFGAFITEFFARAFGKSLKAQQVFALASPDDSPIAIAGETSPDFDLPSAMQLFGQGHAEGFVRLPGRSVFLYPFFQENQLTGFAALEFSRKPSEAVLKGKAKAAKAGLVEPLSALRQLLRVEGAERQNRDMQLSFETGLQLLSLHDTQMVAQRVVELAVERLGFDGGALYLFQGASERARLYAAENVTVEANPSLAPKSLLRTVFLKKNAKIVPVSGLQDLFPLGDPDFDQAYAAPLIAHDEQTGTLFLFKKFWGTSGSRPLSLTAIGMFGQQASHALDHARLYEEVERIAETDALTGLYNRHHFERVLRREIARVRRHPVPISLLMVDICDFKRVNDTYGHLAGDEILKATARLLGRCVRESDIVARFGGDEFVILMPNTKESQARLVQERISHASKRYNERVPPHQRFVLSMGLKSALEFNPQTLIDEADRAMYQDKDLRIRRRMIEAMINNNDRDLDEIDKTVGAVLKVLKEKEVFYFAHAQRVMQESVRMGRELSLDDEAIENLSLAALLHDVGKVAIQTSILNKPGPLSEEEYEMVKTHTVLGEDLLSGVTRLREVRMIIRAHHERWDGRTDGVRPGYPDGLSHDTVPLAARIIRVADMYDAMTMDRPYRAAQPKEVALGVISNERGKSLDPTLVDLFLLRQQAAN